MMKSSANAISPPYRIRSRTIPDKRHRRLLPLLLFVVASFALLGFLRRSTAPSPNSETNRPTQILPREDVLLQFDPTFHPSLPEHNEQSLSLHRHNLLPPRNADRFPLNATDSMVVIVLYVHNRPEYLKLVVDSLSSVDGIAETLLVVSHDGYFPEMDQIIKGINFCQVKQIYAPYSPHLFPNRFPGISPGDCREKENSSAKHCVGNPDQYGNHRSPKIVSLKHHWWWMMNTVWDGLEETRGMNGHILFIEEDHYIYPNALRNIQLLAALKPQKCNRCYAVNLAPSDVKYVGERWQSLIAEKVGNIGYAFNRTVWRKIHSKAKEFCSFDEYNWDITMWSTVYPSFGTPVYTLRGPRRSAAHFGRCGLHQGHEPNSGCVDESRQSFEIDEADKVPNIDPDWPVHVYQLQSGYQAGFKGWGGWGDKRDRHLCLSFAYIYHMNASHSA